MDEQALVGLFGTPEERSAIEWDSLKQDNGQLCAVHPLIQLSSASTTPSKQTVLELMQDVMEYWFDDRIECVRADGKKIAIVPLKGWWRIGAMSGRGLTLEKPAECHDKLVEMVFWSREAVESDNEMRSAVPEDLLPHIAWWFVGIDPIAAR